MKYFACVTTFVVFMIGIVHIYWGHGGNWPGEDRQDLIDKVYGQGTEFPSIYACYFVAFALFLVALFPLLVLNIISFPGFSNYINWSMIFVILIFILRGVGSYLPFAERNWNKKFIKNNRRIYNPLCIALALSYFILLNTH